jgi:hypothetical protein
MGQYTAHWQAYAKSQKRDLLSFALLFGLGLPATALLSFGLQRLTGEYPVWIHLSALLVWLLAFTRLVLRGVRVTCPRCATVYSRGKYLCDCPSCGLRMLQEDP